LGFRVEQYTGLQLRSVPDLDIHPEVTWDGPNGEEKSVDWFVILESVVLLIECKSARLPLDARAGGVSLVHTIDRYLGKSRDQINRTAAKIKEGHPAFAHFPAGRDLIGLTVTAEALYFANSRAWTADLPPTSIPTLTISLREVELLVANPIATLERLLTEIALDPELSTWMVSSAIGSVDATAYNKRNRLLDESWGSFDWARKETDDS
jgi:hypothetical protein